jgi:hypothetical protein
MLSRFFKTLALFVTAIIVILTVLAGLTFAVNNSCGLAAVLPNLANLNEYFDTSQCPSCITGLIFIAFLFLLFLWRAFFLREQQH